jgi:Rhodopirellula transposase DDE domain
VDPLLARTHGRRRHPNAREVTITANCGGSNGARVRLWKLELQKLADETGLVIRVHHCPPGTSKWNKIKHRLFCHITQNWRGRPLTDRLAVVELIGATTTKTGLKGASGFSRSRQGGSASSSRKSSGMPPRSFCGPRASFAADFCTTIPQRNQRVWLLRIEGLKACDAPVLAFVSWSL